MKETKDIIAANYPQLARELQRPLLALLIHCITMFNGDATKFLVFLSVAVRTTMHRDFTTHTQEELLSGEIPVFPALPINVRSIAESLGLPKETIRRKVAELADAGWLVREHGRIYATAAAYRELPLREHIQALAARYYELVAVLKTGLQDNGK